MRALWPCDELWIARAVLRLERATERKADGSVVGKLSSGSTGIMASSEPQACSIGGRVLLGVGLVCLVCCQSRTSREPRASLHPIGVGASNPESESQSALSHGHNTLPPASRIWTGPEPEAGARATGTAIGSGHWHAIGDWEMRAPDRGPLALRLPVRGPPGLGA